MGSTGFASRHPGYLFISGGSGVGVCGGGAVAGVANAGAGIGAMATGFEAEAGTTTCTGAGMDIHFLL